MLRTSSYTIYVDLPGNAEEMLILQAYTGAYDRVSRRVATYLRALESHRPPRPLYGDWAAEPPVEGQATAPSEQTLAVLRRRGYLTTMTREQEEDLFTRIVAKIHAKALKLAPAYVLMPTYDCNLRCPYCFQDSMRREGAPSYRLRVMDREAADRVFSAMFQLEKFHGIEEPEKLLRRITFFGGEPLLATSRPIIEYIVNMALAQGRVSLGAVTNGTELATFRELLGPDKISDLQITLDGPPREHDQRRVYKDGRGSFAQIAENITMALDLGVFVSVRTNVDRNNICDLPELADEMVRRGWDRQDRFKAYISAIRPESDKNDAGTTLSLWDISRELTRLRRSHENLKVISTSDEPTRVRATRVFSRDGMSYPMMKSAFCGAHTSMYVFDLVGDIYACWERTGEPAVRIGKVQEAGKVELNRENFEMWHSRTVASNAACRKCRYALYCGGGCASLAMTCSGTYFRNFCDGFSSRFRASVAEAYADFVAGVEPEIPYSENCEI
jgi:uncharacterized protein